MMSIEAMKHYEAALLEAFPRGATGDVFEHWNKARQAIAEAEKQEPVALQMDVIVVNLVREGINKHRARELAEHFIKYTHPQLKRERVVFPTMLRKMWSGGEVQAWLDENVNKENT